MPFSLAKAVGWSRLVGWSAWPVEWGRQRGFCSLCILGKPCFLSRPQVPYLQNEVSPDEAFPRCCLYFVGISVHMVESDRGFPFKIPSEELGWEGADLYRMLSALMARLRWIWVCTPRTRREPRAAVPSPFAVSLSVLCLFMDLSK